MLRVNKLFLRKQRAYFKVFFIFICRPAIKDIFQSISAKSDGEPCCDWVSTERLCPHFLGKVSNY